MVLSYLDDFDGNRSELLYFIRETHKSSRYNLIFPELPPPGMRSGHSATVRGAAVGTDLYVETVGFAPEASESLAYATSVESSDQSTVVMVANFQDAVVECPVQAIRDLMFTDLSDQSVDDLYRETSHGQLSLSGDVVGPYNLQYSSGGCSIDSWASAADRAAQAAGVNLNNYSRRVYVMPRNGCGAAGIGDLGGSNTQAWVFRCGMATTYAHELGHNFGMHHAATPTSEYGDSSSFMGLASTLRHVNAAHKEQMGWVAGSQVQTVKQAGRYDLAPLELDAAATLAPQILKIAPHGSGGYYYVSYRRGIGFDVNLPTTYSDRLSVHEYPGDFSTSKTYLLGTVGTGETFNDGNDHFSVTLISQNADYATLDVSFDGSTVGTCTENAPGLNATPSSQSGSAGTTLNYTVTLVNNDSGDCNPSTFDLSVTSQPGGWIADVTTKSASLVPGQSASVALQVTSSVTALPGDYSLQLSAADGLSASHSGAVTLTYAVSDGTPVSDTEAPEQPTGLTAKVKGQRVELSWSPTTDNVAVTGYDVYRDGSIIGASPGTRFADYTVESGLAYQYAVLALDAAGNRSPMSSPLTVDLSSGNGGQGGGNGNGNGNANGNGRGNSLDEVDGGGGSTNCWSILLLLGAAVHARRRQRLFA
jgi:hypothetical protein